MTLSLRPATSYAAGSNPAALVAADMNGDGKLDLVVANSGGGVSVLYGTGTGTFSTATTFAAGTAPAAVAAADFNGDGLADLAVANAGGGISVLLSSAAINVTGITSVSTAGTTINPGKTVTFTVALGSAVQVVGSPTLLLNNGGTATYNAASSTSTSLAFTYTVAFNQDTTDLAASSISVEGLNTAVSYPVSPTLNGIAAADFNHDGKADLVATNGGAAVVLLNNGSGGFGAGVSYAAGTGPDAVATADVNGDGNLDLIVADAGGGVSVLRGDGTGGFLTATTYAAGLQSTAVTTADLNGDGKTDLVVANGNGTVNVLLNDGTGGFGAATAYAAGTTPASVAVADLDGDGRPDLIVANTGGGVSVLLGTGGGAFSTATSFAAGSGPVAVAAADVSGDGKPDVLVADSGGGVSVLLDTSTNGTGLGGVPGGDTGIIVDTRAPTVSTVIATPGTAVLGQGGVVTITLTLNEVVTVANGVPTLSLNDGGTASYTSGSGTNTLVYTYVVAANQNTADLTITSTAFNGATVVDAAGNQSSLSNAVTNPGGILQIDTTAPVVTIALAADTGASNTDRITRSAALTGTGEAGGQITVRDGTTVLGSTTVTSGGTWNFTPPGLIDGAYTLSAAEVDAAGNIGTASLQFMLDTAAPSAPSIQAVTVAGSATPAGSVSFKGTAEAGSLITLSDNGAIIGTATASSLGAWTITPAAALAAGANLLTATASDSSGNQSAASSAFSATVLNQAATSGTLTVSATDHLLLLGGLQGATVAYNGVGGTAIVGGLQPVTGSIQGLTDGDTFDIAGVSDISTYLQGVVSLSSAGVNTGSIKIRGGTVNDRFVTQSDGQGGTLIVHQAVTPGATDIRFTDTVTGTSGADPDTAYIGPVGALQHQYIWASTDDVAISATQPDTFLHGGVGADALAVISGTNVLDGGSGSNFLVGGTGQDTFFVDGRGGGDTWSTIVNFHQGDQATIFGFHAGLSTRPLTALDGVAGFQGVTIHSELNGTGTGVQASLTFAGVSLETAQSHLVFSTGTVGGADYLLIQYQ